MRRSFHGIALAAIMLGVTGCAGTAPHVARGPAPGAPAMLLAQARQALGAQNGEAAVSFAELAVRAAPGDAEARRLLAQAYFAAGRLHSAVEAYDDLLTLKPGDADAGLKRAVALLAAGDERAALQALSGAKAVPADAGLAYALAGDSKTAIALLSEAARLPTATARTRQNLALAHALAGNWAQARTIAEQDLPPELVDARMADWSRLASADASRRTQTVLAVAPAAEDAGRPVELALGDAPATRLAQAAPAAMPARTAAPEAPPRDMPVLVHAAELTMPEPVGGWVVQLGAFSRPELADKAWSEIRTGTTHLVQRLAPVRSTVTAAGNRLLYRLSVGGLRSLDEAERLCGRLRAQGNDCYVRRSWRDEPVRLAERKAASGA